MAGEIGMHLQSSGSLPECTAKVSSFEAISINNVGGADRWFAAEQSRVTCGLEVWKER